MDLPLQSPFSKPRTLTTNINNDAVGLDQEKTLPTDLMKPVMGLIPVAKRTKKNVFTMKARYTSETKFSFLLWKTPFQFTPYLVERVACLNLMKTKQKQKKIT